jgi:hypothetical protein
MEMWATGPWLPCPESSLHDRGETVMNEANEKQIPNLEQLDEQEA